MKIDTGAGAAYTATTAILSGLSCTPALSASDLGATVFLTYPTTPAVYSGRIKRFISASSVELWPASTLPSGSITLPQYGVAIGNVGDYTLAAYLARVRVYVQDKINKLNDEEYQSLLASAVSDYSVDRALTEPIAITNETDTQLFNLSVGAGDFWREGFSTLESVEWPLLQFPPTIVPAKAYSIYERSGVWYVYFNSGVVGFAAGNAPIFTVRYPGKLTSGSSTLPANDVTFNAITLLASAYSCFALASAYALSTDTTIVGDAVNYGEKSAKYLTLGKEFIRRYNTTVFGAEDPPSKIGAGTVTIDLERRASDRGSFIFH